MKKKQNTWAKSFFGIFALGMIGLSFFLLAGLVYLGFVGKIIDNRMEGLKTNKSTQLYALYPKFKVGQKFSQAELKAFIVDQGYLLRPSRIDLSPGEYHWEKNGSLLSLTLFRPPFSGAGHSRVQFKVKLVFDDIRGELSLIEIVSVDGSTPMDDLENLPKSMGAYFAGRARTQDWVRLSEIPVSARLAVMAIEDVHFLDHHGVSLRGTVRALWEDLKALKFVQGGSTITQQLMKNLFFSTQKVLMRKIKEAVYAFVAENRLSKEDILEAYLNEVYLGQWGTREIHGFSESAHYYFNRSVSQLSLSQSATLAAIIQAPNSHDPHRRPERTEKRRNLVLKMMLEAGFILNDEYAMAVQGPLGVVPQERTLDDAYYAIELVIQRLPDWIRSRLDSEAFSIYVTLNPFLQSLAAKTLKSNLERLKTTSPEIRKKSEKGIHLQGALIAVNVEQCSVLALQGGSSYQQTQFNRVTQGKRQPGSLFKPFVYLSAMMANSSETPFNAMTEIEDAPFEWKYDKQIWSPKNYDGKFRGFVALRQALENSLNVPTAKLAQLVGIDAIHDVLIRAGIRSPIPKVPSISLGSAEVIPLEMAEAFTTLASLGKHCKLRPYVEIYDSNGNSVEKNELDSQQTLPPQAVFQTINMMKGVFTHGTARSANQPGFLIQNFAGKTGTTNDNMDTWFVGFSPEFLVLIWIGYDEKEKVGLTGSTAALPLWIDFVKNSGIFFSNLDFQVPEGLVPVTVDRDSNAVANPECKNIVVDYFVEGAEPKNKCSLTH